MLHLRAMSDDSIQASFTVGSIKIGRICYGDEREGWGADGQPCHDCGVTKGELHTFGCDAERCPVCGGQVIYCECDFDDELVREKRAKI